MEAKLISITQSLILNEELKTLNPEELIVYIARVSNPSNQNNHGTAVKLLSYLIKNKHWSPLEMVDMTVEVKTSRAIAAQILRHWSFSFQEFSQRYANVVDFEPIELRKQAITNRQSSEEVFDPILSYGEKASKVLDNTLEYLEELYKELLDKGVAKECARMILPLTTQTTIYMKANVRDWVHYFSQRCDSHAQLEHRKLAWEIRKIFDSNFPNLAFLLNNTEKQ